jgi:hypothetical protein
MADPILNYRDIRFDAQGRPYLTTQSGQRSYIPPNMAAQYAGLFIPEGPEKDALTAERGYTPDTIAGLTAFAQQGGVTSENPSGNVPSSSFMRSRGSWNPQTGQYDQGMNMSGVGGLILGGAGLAAPMVVGPMLAGTPTIFGGAGAASAASGSAPTLASANAPAALLPTTTAPGVTSAATSGALAPTVSAGAAPGTLAGAMTPVSQGVINGSVVTGGITNATGTPVANGVLTAANNPGTAAMATQAANPWSALLNPVNLVNMGMNGVGAYLSSRAANKAADQQAESAREALALRRDMYERDMANQAPWLSAGTGAVMTLANLMGTPMPMPAGMRPQSGPGAQAVPRVGATPLGGGTPSRVPPTTSGVTLGGIFQPTYTTPPFNPNSSYPAMVNRTTSYAPMSAR